MYPFNIYKYNIPPPMLLFRFSFSILEIHKLNCRNYPELLSVEFIALLYPGGDLIANSFRVGANIVLKIAIHRASKLSFLFQIFVLSHNIFLTILRRYLTIEGGSNVTGFKITNQDLVKLDKFDGTNFIRWQDKMKFLLTALKIFYVLDVVSLKEYSQAHESFAIWCVQVRGRIYREMVKNQCLV
jgi:hypothetical protein